MPLCLNLLLLGSDLNGLGVNQLLELLLLADEEVLLVGVGLSGNSVQGGGNGLIVDDRGWQSCGGANQLGILDVERGTNRNLNGWKSGTTN